MRQFDGTRPRRRLGHGPVVAAESALLPGFTYLPAPTPTALQLGSVDWLQTHLGNYRFITLGPITPDYGSYFGVAEANINDLPVPKSFNHEIATRLDPNALPGVFSGGGRMTWTTYSGRGAECPSVRRTRRSASASLLDMPDGRTFRISRLPATGSPPWPRRSPPGLPGTASPKILGAPDGGVGVSLSPTANEHRPGGQPAGLVHRVRGQPATILRPLWRGLPPWSGGSSTCPAGRLDGPGREASPRRGQRGTAPLPQQVELLGHHGGPLHVPATARVSGRAPGTGGPPRPGGIVAAVGGRDPTRRPDGDPGPELAPGEFARRYPPRAPVARGDVLTVLLWAEFRRPRVPLVRWSLVYGKDPCGSSPRPDSVTTARADPRVTPWPFAGSPGPALTRLQPIGSTRDD